MRRILCKAFHRVKISQDGRHRDQGRNSKTQQSSKHEHANEHKCTQALQTHEAFLLQQNVTVMVASVPAARQYRPLYRARQHAGGP
jgi:hypothetical protein